MMCNYIIIIIIIIIKLYPNYIYNQQSETGISMILR